MGYAEFVKNLKQLNNLQNESIFAICGSEIYLRDLYFQIVKYKFKNYSMEKYNCEDLNEKEAITYLQSDDLFSDKKLIIYQNLDSIRGEKRSFQEYINNPDSDLIVIMLCNSDDNETKLKKLFKSSKNVLFLDCSPFKLYNDDIDLFIERLCNVKNFKIDNESKNLFKRRCGGNLYQISNELQKLFTLKNEEKSINIVDTEKTLTQFEQASVFEIIDAIVKKDLNEAIAKTSSLFQTDSNAAMMISYNLHYFFERLLITKKMKEDNKAEKDIAVELKISPFIIKKDYFPRIKSFKYTQILTILKSLTNLDLDLRQGSISNRNLMDNFIFNLCK